MDNIKNEINNFDLEKLLISLSGRIGCFRCGYNIELDINKKDIEDINIVCPMCGKIIDVHDIIDINDGCMNKMDLKIGEYVYHKDLYDYREPFKVVGLAEDTVTLEGDFSSMYGVIQRLTLPIKGVSRIYNYGYKLECRDLASKAVFIYNDLSDEGRLDLVGELCRMITKLTHDVALNEQF